MMKENNTHRSHGKSTLDKPGDFTTTPRTIIIALFAIVIGAIGAFVALILLRFGLMVFPFDVRESYHQANAIPS